MADNYETTDFTGLSPKPTSTATAVALPHLHGVRMTAYGHSFGQVQSTPNTWSGSRYPERIRDNIKADTALYNNRTVNGQTMAQIASNAASTWVDGNGGLVTLMGNQNSVGAHVGQTTFKANLRSFINTILGSTGNPPTLLIFKDTTCTATGYARYSTPPTDSEVISYNGWVQDVVAEYPGNWIVVADPLGDGWNPNTMTCPDGQHPNDIGMAHIASSGIKALRSTAFRAGLNIGVSAAPVAAPQTQSPANGTVTDTFNRADNATSLGATDTGQTYTLLSTGDVFGISGAAAYRPTPATSPLNESYAVIDTGKSDFDISVTVSTVASGGCGPVFRALDAANLWVVDVTSTASIKLYKRALGSYTAMATLQTANGANGTVVRVKGAGTTITCYINGSQVAQIDDMFNIMTTKHGIRFSGNSTNGGTARLKNLSIS